MNYLAVFLAVAYTCTLLSKHTVECCWRSSPQTVESPQPPPTQPGADAIIGGDNGGNQTEAGNGTSQPQTRLVICSYVEKNFTRCKNGQCLVNIINNERKNTVCKCDKGFAGTKCDYLEQQANTQMIIVIVIIAVFVLLCIIALVIFIMKRRHQQAFEAQQRQQAGDQQHNQKQAVQYTALSTK